MYKIDYYTLSKMSDGSLGNIKQFSDTWYTEQDISSHQKELERVLDIMYKPNKFYPVITNIQKIEGHTSR